MSGRSAGTGGARSLPPVYLSQELGLFFQPVRSVATVATQEQGVARGLSQSMVSRILAGSPIVTTRVLGRGKLERHFSTFISLIHQED